MKLRNHKKHNFYRLANADMETMHGTIEVSKEENEAIACFLLKEYQKALMACDTYKRDSLSNRAMSKDKKFVSVGVLATQLIAHRFNLIGYRNDRNYAIKTVNRHSK